MKFEFVQESSFAISMFKTLLRSSQKDDSEGMDMAVNFVEPWACNPFVYVIDSETLKDQPVSVKHEGS